MSTIKLKKLVAEIYQEVINQMTLGITINYKELTEACIIIESSKDLTIKQSQFLITKLLDFKNKL